MPKPIKVSFGEKVFEFTWSPGLEGYSHRSGGVVVQILKVNDPPGWRVSTYLGEDDTPQLAAEAFARVLRELTR